MLTTENSLQFYMAESTELQILEIKDDCPIFVLCLNVAIQKKYANRNLLVFNHLIDHRLQNFQIFCPFCCHVYIYIVREVRRRSRCRMNGEESQSECTVVSNLFFFNAYIIQCCVLTAYF